VLCGSSYDGFRRLQKKETPIITRGKYAVQRIVNFSRYQRQMQDDKKFREELMMLTFPIHMLQSQERGWLTPTN
jgi:hypothetical protein